MDNLKEGRLSMRREGDVWKAYYAKPDTMDGAVFLGSIKMDLISENLDRRRAFMHMMADAAAELITDATGLKVDWTEIRTAPEYERIGHA